MWNCNARLAKDTVRKMWENELKCKQKIKKMEDAILSDIPAQYDQ